MKTNDKLKLLAEDLVKLGNKNGADQVQVLIIKSEEFDVDVRNGDIEKLQQAGSIGLSLKVILDQKVATASSSDLNIDTLHNLLKSTVERAKYSSPDPFSALPEKEEIQVGINKLDIFDPKIPELSPEVKIEKAKELEKKCLTDKRIKLSLGSSFSTVVGEVILANSNGFSGSYKYTRCNNGIGLQSGEGDNLYEDYWYDYSVNLKELMSIEEIAKKAVQRVTRIIGAKKIKTQNVPVVIEQPMAGMVLGFLASCIDGDNIYMNRSFLAGKIGERIAGGNVNIYDDGTIPALIGTRPFDREGVPAQMTPVIEAGILKNYLLDTYSARKLKMKSTGNASGTNNFYLTKGSLTPEEIIKSVDKGLYLTKTIGQGTVTTTGDISKGAFGLWIEKGELSYPVHEVTISGNLGNILRDIEMIGNDLEFRRSINGPTIKIKEMTISGK